MTGRDTAGRFAKGNPWASAGGRARARAGWRALVALRFNDDPAAAGAWLGAWASDAPYRALFPVFPYPGPCPAPHGAQNGPTEALQKNAGGIAPVARGNVTGRPCEALGGPVARGEVRA